MSMYDVSNRFRAEISTALDNTVISLPLLTREAEILFFYSTKGVSQDAYIVKRIEKIVFRSLDTGYLSTKYSKDFFDEAEIETICGQQIFQAMSAADENRLFEEYHSLYEQIGSFLYNNTLSEKEVGILKRLLICFTELVSANSLRRIYFTIGREFFDYISNQTGISLERS